MSFNLKNNIAPFNIGISSFLVFCLLTSENVLINDHRIPNFKAIGLYKKIAHICGTLVRGSNTKMIQWYTLKSSNGCEGKVTQGRTWGHTLHHCCSEGRGISVDLDAGGSSTNLDGLGIAITTVGELSNVIWVVAIGVWGNLAMWESPLPGLWRNPSSGAGVSGAAADNFSSEAVADWDTGLLFSISRANGLASKPWAPVASSVTEGGNNGSWRGEVMWLWDTGEASAEDEAKASAAFAFSAALLSISSIRRWTIRGISCT